uniref:Protein tyrosine phosphatase receptor type D n=1 Tax=Gallus gallus TaxID=9031 RepID=A0A8V0YKR4_CHICK
MLVPSSWMMHVVRPVVVLLCFLLCADAETPPKFTRTPVDQTGVSGGVASFICQATGDPRPKIVWNKKGKKVSNQRFEVIEFDDGSGSVLRIQPLRTPRDEAIYECVASNSVGEISVSTRLTVLRGPNFGHSGTPFSPRPGKELQGMARPVQCHPGQARQGMARPGMAKLVSCSQFRLICNVFILIICCFILKNEYETITSKSVICLLISIFNTEYK